MPWFHNSVTFLKWSFPTCPSDKTAFKTLLICYPLCVLYGAFLVSHPHSLCIPRIRDFILSSAESLHLEYAPMTMGITMGFNNIVDISSSLLILRIYHSASIPEWHTDAYRTYLTSQKCIPSLYFRPIYSGKKLKKLEGNNLLYRES